MQSCTVLQFMSNVNTAIVLMAQETIAAAMAGTDQLDTFGHIPIF